VGARAHWCLSSVGARPKRALARTLVTTALQDELFALEVGGSWDVPGAPNPGLRWMASRIAGNRETWRP